MFGAVFAAVRKHLDISQNAAAVIFGAITPLDPARMTARIDGTMGGRNAENSYWTASLCIGAALLHPNPREAQPIPIARQGVIPFPAGGPTDGMARIISDRLATDSARAS